MGRGEAQAASTVPRRSTCAMLAYDTRAPRRHSRREEASTPAPFIFEGFARSENRLHRGKAAARIHRGWVLGAGAARGVPAGRSSSRAISRSRPTPKEVQQPPTRDKELEGLRALIRRGDGRPASTNIGPSTPRRWSISTKATLDEQQEVNVNLAGRPSRAFIRQHEAEGRDGIGRRLRIGRGRWQRTPNVHEACTPT